jgi:ribosomal protein L37AE/L43A
MATHQQSTTKTYRCPDCNDVLAFTAGTWTCAECGHAPRHGAD